MAAQVVYNDDVDAFVTWTVTDAEGQDLDWATPTIAVGNAAYGSAAWLGVAGPTRAIKLSTPSGLGLTPGVYAAYLKVPSGSDFQLGLVEVRART